MVMPKIQATQLREFIQALFESAGVSTKDSVTIADVMVWANLRGVDSHGVSRVPRYLELFESGEANARAELTVTSSKPGVALIDAHRAPGPVALVAAADEAIARARANGVGWVAIRETVHTGAIGYYTSRIADAGFVGVGIVAGMPNMAYEGAAGASVATSPLSIAVPGTGTHPTAVLDMATAVIALGKIAQYKKQGKPLPDNAATTPDGVVTTDASLATIPLPVGGAKGSGLSLMFELLTSVLVGAPILPDFHGGVPGGKKHRQNASIIAVDISAFGDAEAFARNVDATTETIRSLPAAEGSDGVLVPGDHSAQVYTERAAGGVPVPDGIWTELTTAATAAAVAIPATA
jgi:ureidoglycolate dehydrogenase (NAD+)